ncbi:MAG: SGNH/GDSL hydrolase family protein [Nocardioidaceae bacterium]|nr:SGNH/GDSL hydrolase family protein [Nocardioidaceae bacterium]
MIQHVARSRLTLGVLAVVLAAAITLVLARPGESTDRCLTTTKRAEQRAALVTGKGGQVLVIGDSYSVGAGAHPRESWPVRLPGRVRVAGFSGSGFSAGASACGDVSYGTRAPAVLHQRGVHPTLVIVEGGLNDTDQPIADVETGFERLLLSLDDLPTLVVGPPRAPARPADRVDAVDAALARLAASHGTHYLSMLDVELTYADDDLHPDRAGHRVFGDVVAAEIERLWRGATKVGDAV